MSSAYSGFKNDTKSTESVLMNSLNSSDLPLSIQGANHFSKHFTDDQVLVSSVGNLEEFLTEFENNQIKSIENYLEQSSLGIHSNQLTALDNFEILNTEDVWPTGTIFTPELNSITHSIDVPVSSTPLNMDTNDFRAETFEVKHTGQISNFNTQRLLEPSEWRADIFPSVAYDEALFSAFSVSNTLEFDYGIYNMESANIQSKEKEFSSSISGVSPMESDFDMLLLSSFQVIPSSSLIGLHSMQSFSSERSEAIWSQTEIIPSSQDFFMSFPSESYSPSSSQIIPSEVYNSSSIPREITLESSSVGALNEMSSHSDILIYPITSLTANDTSSLLLTSSLPDMLPTTDIPTTTMAMPTTATDMETTATDMATTTTAIPTTPTATTITTTTGKVVFKDCRFLFTFSGDCHLIINNTLYLAEFIEGLRKTLVETLHISNDRMKPHDISCGSIKIYVTFKNVSYPEFKRRIEYVVEGRNFIVPTYIENVVVTFTALSVEEVALPPGDVDSSDLPQRGIDNIDIIVIIVACCVCGILIVIGITVCVKECYKRKHAQSFDLLDMPHVNLKLEDFTLTRIPRPKTNYNTDNVTANPYTDRYNQQTKKENGQQVSNGNHIDLKDVHVRMQPLKNEGIIVGVTGYASANGAPRKKKRAPSASSRQSHEDHLRGDPSTESLVPETNSSSMGASNPIFVDDEQGSTSTLDVNRSYHS
ncbi:hypothetical protein LOTGIDRAFT_170806 [Lottia gigantea]|uniref:SEA domain-containing protein n=1 Tax=Lottia gigantea TaxID=225164 RepID=V4CPS8_LOTGI|nr:hypothetical protein LOTGIDRAFT_170806 [Lottia gigantea]ESP04415.1 hypothetical protein LOTGIDRAFT_170806 [Lottia gigantea]